jgi:putative heme-binding domain-containing protein
VIEHPEWVPEELKHRPDERWGENAGRIYRVTREDATGVDPIFRELRERPLASRPNRELVTLLSHTHGWVRSMAARILEERPDVECTALLEEFILRSRSVHPNGLLRAVHGLVRRGVWTNAKLERLLAASSDSERIHDPSLRAALWRTASHVSEPWTAGLIGLARDAIRDGHREEMLAASRAVASRVGNDLPLADPLLDACVERATDLADDREVWMALGSVCRSRLLDFGLAWGERAEDRSSELRLVQGTDWDVWSQCLRLAIDPANVSWQSARNRWWDKCQQRMAAPASSGEAERRVRDAPALRHLLAMARGILDSPDREWLLQKPEFWTWLSQQCDRDDRTVSVRETCIQLLAVAPNSSSQATATLRSISEQLDAPKFAKDRRLSMAAFRAWAKRSDPQFAAWVVEHYRQAGPELRSAMWQAMRAAPDRVMEIVRAIEQERLPIGMFDASQLQNLRSAAGAELQPVVDRLIDQRIDRDRKGVIDRYAAALGDTYDRKHGKEIFGKYCATCHRVDGLGESMGPEISDTRTQSPLQLLIAILDPRRAVDPRFAQTIVRLEDGSVHDGFVVEESSQHVVLRNQHVKSLVIRRDTIDSIHATGRSLMPEGMESQIDPSAMNDLIGYLKNWRYASGSVIDTKAR